MKYLFFIIIYLSLANTLKSQKVALLNLNFKTPILYTDSVTVEQVKSGYFPVEEATIDTFMANLNYLKNLLEVRQRAKMEYFELRAGLTTFKIYRIPFAYGDRYRIKVQSKVKEIEAGFTLTDIDKSNQKNSVHIGRVIGYIVNNFSLFRSPDQIQPKIYEVKVISDH
jgi:hypothetical protein